MIIEQTHAHSKARARQALPYALILLAALAAHGLELISDVRAADDWMYFHWMENGQWGLFKRFHDAYNNGLQAAAIWPLSYFPSVPTAMHAASVFLVAGIGLLVYRIGRAVTFLNGSEALIVALLAIAYPAYMWHVSASYSVFYHLPVLSFYAALLVAIRSEGMAGGGKVAAQSFSVALFLFSFHAGSLLVFFYGAALVHCHAIATARDIGFWRSARVYVIRRAHFWAAPFVFRAAYHFLDHPFINNPLRPSWEVFQRGLADFSSALLAQAKMVASARSFWMVLVVVLVAMVAGRALKRRFAEPPPRSTPRAAMTALCVGLVLLFASIFAYLAVGKTPASGATDGYTTRTLILAQAPLALIVIGLLRLIALSRLSGILAYPVVAGLLASSIALQVENTLKWMSYSVWDRSFYLHLGRIPEARNLTYLVVVDRAYFMATIHHPTASLPFEMADRFRGPTHVFGDLVLEDFDVSKARTPLSSLEELAARYHSPSVIDLVRAWKIVMPTDYRQGVLVICPGPEFHSRSPARLALLYQYYRWIEPEQLEQFLQPLLRLRLITPDQDKGTQAWERPGASGCEPDGGR